MKFLSFDLEATGLEEDCLIIEFAMVPFCSETKTIEQSMAKQFYVKCPSFEELKPTLNPWVIDNNRELIEKAHNEGISHEAFKKTLVDYFAREDVKNYFNYPDKKITLFGKSMNAIDLPFLNRDLGWDFMRQYFHHQVLDLSSVVYAYVDSKRLPPECLSGSKLMEHFSMGEVQHTALEDAVNTAKMYLNMLDL